MNSHMALHHIWRGTNASATSGMILHRYDVNISKPISFRMFFPQYFITCNKNTWTWWTFNVYQGLFRRLDLIWMTSFRFRRKERSVEWVWPILYRGSGSLSESRLFTKRELCFHQKRSGTGKSEVNFKMLLGMRENVCVLIGGRNKRQAWDNECVCWDGLSRHCENLASILSSVPLFLILF